MPPIEIVIPHVGISKPGKLPSSMSDHGYTHSSSKDAMSRAAQYITPDEWSELARGVNAAIEKHSYWKHPCGVPLLFLTLGICFCPLIHVAVEGKKKTRAEVLALPVVGRLEKRGVRVKDWTPRTKFAAGGLTVEILQ